MPMDQQRYAALMASQMGSMGGQQAIHPQQQVGMAQYLQQYQRLAEARSAAAEHRRPDVSTHDLQQQQLQRMAMQQQAQINARRPPPTSHQQPKPRPANIIPHKSAASQYSNKPSLHAYQQYGQQPQQQAHPNTDTTSQAAMNSNARAMNAAPAHAQAEMTRPMSASAQQHQSSTLPPQSQHHSMDYSQAAQQQPAPAAHMGLQSQQQQQQRVPTSQPQPQQAHDHQQRYGQVPDPIARAPPTNRYLPLKAMPSNQHQPTQQQQSQHSQQPTLSHHSPQQPPPQPAPQQQQPSPRDQQHHQQMTAASSHLTAHSNSPHIETSHSIDQSKIQADQLAMQQLQAARRPTKPPNRAPPAYVPMKMDSMRKAKMAEEMEQRSSAQTNVTETQPSLPSESGHSAPPQSSQPLRKPKPATRVPYKMDSMRAQVQDKPEGGSLSSFLGTSSAQTGSQPSLNSQRQSAVTSTGMTIL